MPMSRTRSISRNTFIAACVVVFHIAALWALQTGLLRRVVEVIVPAEVISEFIAPPTPKMGVPTPAPQAPAKPLSTPTPPVTQAQPLNEPAPTANAPLVPAPPTTSPPSAAPAPAAPLKVELPSSDAQYLQNPKPPYPAMSKRLGEQGKVVVRVLISVDGSAQKAEIQQSSGFDRLDQAALVTVLRWRYVPGKRGGVAEAMWFNVPINFVLE